MKGIAGLSWTWYASGPLEDGASFWGVCDRPISLTPKLVRFPARGAATLVPGAALLWEEVPQGSLTPCATCGSVWDSRLALVWF